MATLPCYSCVFWSKVGFPTVSFADDTLFAGQRTGGAQRGLQGHFLLALKMFTVLKFQQEAKNLFFK